MKRTLLVDDLTGTVLPEGSEPVELKVTIDGKSLTLDLTEQSAAAIRALGTEDAPGMFAEIFSADAPSAKPPKAKSSATSDSSAARAWWLELGDGAKELGIPVYDPAKNHRGTLPRAVLDAYAKSRA